MISLVQVKTISVAELAVELKPPSGLVKEPADPKKVALGVDGPPPPSSYMQALISKILSNVHVTFENVIVKVVVEDVVTSFNVRGVKYFTAGESWLPAFVDLTPPDFGMRKVFEFRDFTVCLDRKDAQVYQVRNDLTSES